MNRHTRRALFSLNRRQLPPPSSCCVKPSIFRRLLCLLGRHHFTLVHSVQAKPTDPLVYAWSCDHCGKRILIGRNPIRCTRPR